MEKEADFKLLIETAAKKFAAFDVSKPVRIVSHLDCDGISAAAVLIKLFDLQNINYSISVVQQLDEAVLKELSAEKYSTYVFCDLGSGQITNIKKHLQGSQILILDHHELEDIGDEFVHVNPHLVGIDGNKNISGAGVVYMFAKTINPEIQKISHVPLIGAVGDIQAEDDFCSLNKAILEDALVQGLVEVRKGLKFYGAETRTINKVLEYGFEIPGVNNNEAGVFNFLSELGIDIRKKTGEWKKLVDLTDAEMKKLTAAILIRRVGMPDPESVVGNNYYLKNEESGTELKDLKGFSTVLNACGRLNRASLGIGTCLGDDTSKRKALSNLAAYRREIGKALGWYRGTESKGFITREPGFVIIKAQDQVLDTVIGTLASMISKNNEFEQSTYILALAHRIDGNSKVSLRYSGTEDVDLREVVTSIIARVGTGEAGGHSSAAGAIIPTEVEDAFIKHAKEIFSRLVLEEKV